MKEKASVGYRICICVLWLMSVSDFTEKQCRKKARERNWLRHAPSSWCSIQVKFQVDQTLNYTIMLQLISFEADNLSIFNLSIEILGNQNRQVAQLANELEHQAIHLLLN